MTEPILPLSIHESQSKKKCTKCHVEKPISDFYKHPRGILGVNSYCKICALEVARRYRVLNREKVKESKRKWRESKKKFSDKNKEKSEISETEYLAIKKEKRRIKHKRYRDNNREKVRQYYSEYRKKNRGRINELRRKSDERNKTNVVERRDAYKPRRRKLENKKRAENPMFRLRGAISTGMYSSIKDGKGGRSWEALVEYTLSDLMKHLEKQFKEGMEWENYGKFGWHIDHKIPISAFNFEKPDDIDFKKCWALSNLQPMWAKDNLRKSASLDKPFQPSLVFG